jgi:ATP-binding cassette subfamily C (CFTR/MRP) protein 1
VSSLFACPPLCDAYLFTLSPPLPSPPLPSPPPPFRRIFEGIQEIHYLWGAPIEAAAILILLGFLVGIYALPAVGVIGLIVPSQYYFGFCIINNKNANKANVQARFSIIQEVLPAMKLVKYYAWERFFEKEMCDARAAERKLMFWNAVIKTVNITMVFGVPPLVCCVVLIPYELNQKRDDGGVFITSTTVFVMLSLFNILRFPLVVLPKALRAVSEAYNAINSLEIFLAEPIVHKQDLKGKPGVNFKNAVFQHSASDSFKLNIPNFSIQPGELVAIVGRVGSGKSSLLHAILGNMELTKGEAHSAGVMAYVPQVAWCQNSTLKDNIVFGESFDRAHYDQVIHACALELDLQILPAGDQSKAGLRGINLSGGQRQRLNLARCAYFGGDLVLLDNALSAVDHHTAQHIFKHCVKTMLRDKATVLVTHQVGYDSCRFCPRDHEPCSFYLQTVSQCLSQCLLLCRLSSFLNATKWSSWMPATSCILAHGIPRLRRLFPSTFPRLISWLPLVVLNSQGRSPRRRQWWKRRRRLKSLR